MFYLAFRNVQRRKWESTLSIALIALTVMVFVVAMFTMRMMDKGLNASSERLGADILVLPHVAQADVQQTLFTATPVNIYMDKQITNQVRKLPGVAMATPQFFTQTLNESCCSVVGAKRLVGYDPKTDFILNPWMKSGKLEENLNDGEVIVGSSLPDFLGGKVAILGETFSVVEMLGNTGTGMDETLFVNIDVARKLAKNSPYLKELWTEETPDQLISAVMVKAEKGTKPAEVAEAINQNISGVHAVVAGKVIQGIRSELGAFQKVLSYLFLILFLITSLAMFARFVSIAEQRKRELGLIQALGGTKTDSVKAILFEIGIIVLSGGIIGSIVGQAGGYYLFQWLAKTLDLPTVQLSISSLLGAGGIGIAFSILLGMASAWLPISRSLRNDPVETLTHSEV